VIKPRGSGSNPTLNISWSRMAVVLSVKFQGDLNVQQPNGVHKSTKVNWSRTELLNYLKKRVLKGYMVNSSQHLTWQFTWPQLISSHEHHAVDWIQGRDFIVRVLGIWNIGSCQMSIHNWWPIICQFTKHVDFLLCRSVLQKGFREQHQETWTQMNTTPFYNQEQCE